ncbi:TRAP-T-associated universal stress protein TeaD [Fundidesulfovibrio magnetotacticus]|uniref:Universal stress protein n=1 Tax=Fundidesulfovibrio magnetotacticus TaxID=2730080 RepID=A0A6V8LZ10_9BACT|nr:universal stress protein [Fundidesulfovibrio magnetotacticus]GFK95249.1 TRAP-T-associated universal stress protein TeaD [Fundidesulfovibrio magnetotacticus]
MADFKKILCAVDFSDHSPKLADYAVSLARCTGAKLICVYVAPSLSQYVGFHVPPSSIEAFVGEIVSGADSSMQAYLDAHFKGADATGKVLVGYPAEEILNMAEDEDADLIIMGTHGRTGIDRILFGSVAEKIVKSSKCPVLTIRPEHKDED